MKYNTLLVYGREVMINRDCRGHLYCAVRGDILGSVQAKLKRRRHLKPNNLYSVQHNILHPLSAQLSLILKCLRTTLHLLSTSGLWQKMHKQRTKLIMHIFLCSSCLCNYVNMIWEKRATQYVENKQDLLRMCNCCKNSDQGRPIYHGIYLLSKFIYSSF